MKRIYLSGPMTGIPLDNYPAFIDAAETLRKQGYAVTNPAEIRLHDDATWEDYMRADIKELCDCCTVALLPGWENSKGANIEARLAIQLGMRVVELETLMGEGANG